VDQGDGHRREQLGIQMARVKEKTRPWKEIITLVLAIAAGGISHDAANIFHPYSHYPIVGFHHSIVIAYGFAIVFCVLATSAVLGISGKARKVFEPRLGSAHAAVIRYAALLVGLILILVLTLQLFGVSVGQLLVGGAFTSVLVGIAAQQSMSNIFAGMVLLLSRPFRVGDAIRLRAGALGGQLDGVVTEIGITYIRLDTGESVMSVPNAQVLAAAVGPIPRKPKEPEPPAVAEPENPATRAPGTGTRV
jgi:small-conductance mechanosensitive channel